MNVTIPEKIMNVVEYLAEEKGIELSYSGYYQTIVLAIATLKYIVDNTDENVSVCLYDKTTQKIEEIEIEI